VFSLDEAFARFDHLNWMTTEKPIWFIAEYLCEIPHISLLTSGMEKNLTRVDRRTWCGEMVGHRKNDFRTETKGNSADYVRQIDDSRSRPL